VRCGKLDFGAGELGWARMGSGERGWPSGVAEVIRGYRHRDRVVLRGYLNPKAKVQSRRSETRRHGGQTVGRGQKPEARSQKPRKFST
jgi:hypothetical protein